MPPWTVALVVEGLTVLEQGFKPTAVADCAGDNPVERSRFDSLAIEPPMAAVPISTLTPS
jgi:hypothetical protein